MKPVEWLSVVCTSWKKFRKNINIVWPDKDSNKKENVLICSMFNNLSPVQRGGGGSSSDLFTVHQACYKHDLSWRGLAMFRLLSLRYMSADICYRQRNAVAWFYFLFFWLSRHLAKTKYSNKANALKVRYQRPFDYCRLLYLILHN